MTEEKCDICKKRVASIAIQLSPGDVCDRCWILYLQNYEIPDCIDEKQTFRYIRIKVRKKLGLKV